MTDHESIPGDLKVLIHRACNGVLSDEEVEKLEVGLSENQAACNLFIELARLEARLAIEHKIDEAFRFVKVVTGESQGDRYTTTEAAHGSLPRPGVRQLARWWPQAISALACAATVVLWFSYGALLSDGGEAVPETLLTQVAHIASTHETLTMQGDEGLPPRTRGLAVGEILRLRSGLVSLEFVGGGRVVLEGPAVFEIVSDSGGRLYEGRLVATADMPSDKLHISTTSGDIKLGSATTLVAAEASGEAKVLQLQGLAEVGAAKPNGGHESYKVPEGEGVVFAVDGVIRRLDKSIEAFDFEREVPARREAPPFRGQVIMLGNLFDDATSATLAEAVETDTYRAVADTYDLGIAAAIATGLDINVHLARNGPEFNFSSCGGSFFPGRLASNDSFRQDDGLPIRTTGVMYDLDEMRGKRLEQGIGMHTNSLVTFDLEEIREAGRLGSRAMRFVVDRAGINDSAAPLPDAPDQRMVYLAAVVSTPAGVLYGYVNGEPIEIRKRGDIYSFDGDAMRYMKPLRHRFVSFDVPIPPQAKFLTLASLAGVNKFSDHAVLSGARLELDLDEEGLASRFASARGAKQFGFGRGLSHPLASRGAWPSSRGLFNNGIATIRGLQQPEVSIAWTSL